ASQTRVRATPRGKAAPLRLLVPSVGGYGPCPFSRLCAVSRTGGDIQKQQQRQHGRGKQHVLRRARLTAVCRAMDLAEGGPRPRPPPPAG
ncbi:unnamed protein product, partial [Ectocarpus sp. 12 AP-2014]